MRVNLRFPDQPGDTATGFRFGDGVTDDLELDILVSAMANGDPFLADVAKTTLVQGVDDPEVLRYRHAVLEDCLAHTDAVLALYAVAVEALQPRRYGYGLFSRHPSAVLSGAVETLAYFHPLLGTLRALAAEHATTFSSSGLSELVAELAVELDESYLAELGEHLAQLRLRSGVLLGQQLGEAVTGTNPVLLQRTEESRWWNRIGIGGAASLHFDLHPRDEAGARALSELRDRGLHRVAEALVQSMDHVRELFLQLRSELGFYLACVNLRRRLEARGVPVCWPEPVALPTSGSGSPPVLETVGLYDVCLALTAEGEIVGNDVSATGRPLVLITGANSGGKSTLLRALGVAQLMLQAGMFVGAEHYRGSVATGIFTHFLREEDPSLEHGKLDEELVRMSAIADRLTRGCLVLSNESFASTNEREGSEIARQCFVAFVEAGIRVIGVTHLFALADGFRHQHQVDVLFLRAERGDGERAPYVLVPGPPLSTAFGQDLYDRIFGPAPSPPARSPTAI